MSPLFAAYCYENESWQPLLLHHNLAQGVKGGKFNCSGGIVVPCEATAKKGDTFEHCQEGH